MNLRTLFSSVQFTAAEALASAKGLFGENHGVIAEADLTALEGRVLFSASPMPAEVIHAVEAQHTPVIGSVDPQSTDVETGDTATKTAAVDESAEIRSELVFIDSAVEDVDRLLKDLSASNAQVRELDVVLLNAEQDGVLQITDALSRRSDLDAIHVVSHGTDRAVKLGSTWLSLDNINGYAGKITGWGHSLTGGADLMLYGCDLAGSESGQELLESLSTLTGADIAASTDDTGSARRGADWDLEYAIGDVEAEIFVGVRAQEQWQGLLSTFTVTNTNDSGTGSLRQAILDANSLAGADTIEFSIGTGVQQIDFTSSLPSITDQLTIDAWTQPGFSGTPHILIDANQNATNAFVLTATADGTTIRGFVLRDFIGDVIQIDAGSTNNHIEGNYIGSFGAEGTYQGTEEENLGAGIRVLGADNTIGGSLAHERNLIAGNNVGIVVDGVSATGNTIEGNYIGTDLSGTTAIGNGSTGIFVENYATNNTIGGIGTGQGNVIAFNRDDGIAVQGIGTTGNTIRGNSIHSNDNIGIDLGVPNVDGENPNDPGDLDAGGNDALNWAVLKSTSIADDGTLSYELDTTTLAPDTYTIDFYASSDRDGGRVEGERFLGTAGIVPPGNISFAGTLGGVTLAPGEHVTALTTDSNGNTSEFSNYAVATDSDASGAPPSDLHAVSSVEGGLSINEGGGDDAYLQADNGSSVVGGLTEFTLEARLTLGPAPPSFPHILDYATSAEDRELSLLLSGNTVRVTIADNSVGFAGTYSGLRDGDAHTISVTWSNAGILKLYIDGEYKEQISGVNIGHTIASGGNLIIGNDQDAVGSQFQTSQAVKGTLFDIRIFETVRTDAEIAANYRSTLPYNESGMVANWTFNDISADGVVEETVNGNNLTLNRVAEPGFISGATALTFSVDENAINGTAVGTVLGSDAERDAMIATLLATEPSLTYSAETGKFYQAINSSVTWNLAQSAAVASTLGGVSGQLVVVESASENSLVTAMAADISSHVWLGLSDQVTEGEWRKYDGIAAGDRIWQGAGSGTAINGSYVNWLVGEPNSTIEDFAQLNWGSGKWNDLDSGETNGYVVEWDADLVLDSAQALTYAIDAQDVAGAFAIDATTGLITVANGELIDFEDAPTQDIEVRTTDVDGNSHDKTFTIALNDLAEPSTSPTDLSSGIELNTDGGNDAYLQAQNGFVANLSAVTLEVSFAIDTPNTIDNNLLSYTRGLNHNELYLTVQSDGSVRFAVDSLGTGEFVTSGQFLELLDGQKHHLAVSWENTNGDVTIYVDGELVETATGYEVGSTINSGGTLVLGQDQDLTGFEADQAFRGTYFDTRIWSVVRTEPEIALDYQHKFDISNLPSGLVANWQMDGFNGSNEVVDIVTEGVTNNRLIIGHANGAGFATSTPVGDLHIAENAADGSSVGFVVPHSPKATNNIISDGGFTNAPDPGSFTDYATGQTIGDWTVRSGGVTLLGTYAEAPEIGRAMELDFGGAGGIYQTLNTDIGTQYQVLFDISGLWDGGEAIKDLRVSAAGMSQDYAIAEPEGWSLANMLYQGRSFTFTAAETLTELDFASIDTAGGSFGPAIALVRAYEIPAAVTAVLNNDSTLNYDASTGKFYRVVTATEEWATAQTNASLDELNGVSGNLAAIHSDFENVFLQGLLQDNSVSGAWIGGSDSLSEGTWVWQDGSGDTFYSGGGPASGEYENFGTLEPGGGATENHAELVAVNGDWNDLNGSSSRAYIVEWDASEVLNNFTFSMTDASNNFEIDANTGEITVAATNSLNYESATSHDVDVTVTDAAGNAHLKTITIQVDNIADASLSIPIAQSVNEDTALEFTTGVNAIVIDSGSPYDPIVNVTLSVSNGTLTLATTTGITFLNGTSDGDATLTISGTESSVNTAFDGLKYIGDQDYNGSDSLNVTTGSSASTETNLYARYEFPGGSTADQSGNGNDGTSAGNPTPTSDAERGDVMTFDGDDMISITNGTAGLGDEVTISAWVNLDAGQNNNVPLSIGDTFYVTLDPTNPSFGMGVSANGFTTNTLTTADRIAGSGWHHVAATLNDTTNELNLYLDGLLIHNSDYDFGDIVWATEPSQNITIGAMSDGSNALAGSLDDIRVYDSELRQAEIIGIMGDQGFDSASVAITVNAVNDPPFVSTNSGLAVDEGGSTAITNLMLNEGDPDDNGAGVIYRVRTDVNGGSIFLNGNVLEQNDTFTQTDIDAGLVSYTHAGGEDTTEAIRLAIADGGEDGASETNFAVSVSITPANDAPVAVDDPAGGTVLPITDIDTVGFWRLGESAGATVVDAAGGNDGTQINVTLGASGVTSGDTAGDFSGSNSYVNLGKLDVAGTGITMAAWINADTFGGGDGRIFAKSDGIANIDHSWMLSVIDIGADVFLRLRVSAGDHTEVLISQTPSLNTGQWYHVAGTYDQASGEMAIYVDGSLVEFGTHSVGGAVDQDPSRDAWIGGNPAGSNYFDGRIDEALLMQRAFLADEIAALAELAPPDYSVTESGTITINAANGVLQNDSDVEGDALVVAEVNGVAASVGNQITLGSGALLTVAADGSFDYAPNAQFTGLDENSSATDAFTYTVSDGTDTDTAIVSVTINGENDVPVLGNHSLTISEGGQVVLTPGMLSATDEDDNDLDLIYTVSNETAVYFARLSTNVTVTNFTQAEVNAGNIVALHIGSDTTPSFDIAVSDGLSSTAPTAATIAYTAINDQPFLDANGLFDELIANTNKAGEQIQPGIATLTSGNYVISWNDGVDSLAQIFASDGSTVGGELILDDTASVGQTNIAATSTGGFVATWASGGNIYARVLDSSGMPLGGSIVVASAASSYPPEIVELAGGKFAVTFGHSGDVMVQLLTSGFALDGTAITVPDSTTGPQSLGHIASLQSGGFVVTFGDATGLDGESYGTYARLFDSDGVAVGASFLLSQNTAGPQRPDSVAQLAGGSIVFTWRDNTSDGASSGVIMRIFNSGGTAVSNDIVISQTTAGHQDDANLLALADGTFVAVWQSGGSDGAKEVFARHFAADGTALSDEMLLNTKSEMQNRNPQATQVSGSTIAITWAQGDAAGTNHDIVQRHFDFTGEILSYTENDSPTVLHDHISLVDFDHANLEGAVVQIAVNYGDGEDLLTFANQNGITGTWNPTNGTMTLAGTATIAEYEAALRSISYENLSETPTGNTRTVSWSAYDGFDTGFARSSSIDVSAVNDAPTFINLNSDTLNYTERDGQVVIEQGGNAVVGDVDSVDFDGGTLTVNFSAGSDPTEDILAIRSQGTGAGQIDVSGSDVTFGGTTIGSFTGGSGGANLVITFNANATSTAVTMVMQNVTYENTDTANPTIGARTVDYIIGDGDGGVSTTQYVTINVVAINDQAIADLNGSDGGGRHFSTTFTEGLGAVHVADADATITDGDHTTYDGLGVNLAGFADGTVERITVGGYAFTHGLPEVVARTVDSTNFNLDFDGTGFTISNDLGGTMPESDIQTLLRGIAYENTSHDPTAGSRTLTFIPEDASGQNGLSSIATISVNPVNDAPTLLTANSTPTFTEDGGLVSLFSNTTVDLVEADDLVDSLILTVNSLVDGSDELLVVDGHNIELTHLHSAVTAANGYQVDVSTSGSTATVTITNGPGFSASAAELLVDGLAYNNRSDNPLGAVRLINLISIRDTGGTGSGGVDSAGVGLSSLVTIVAVNDAPSVTAPATALNATEQVALAIQGTGFTVSDVDDLGGSATATLAVGEGTLTVNVGTTGVHVTGGNGTSSVAFSGTIRQINDLLEGRNSGTIGYMNSSDSPAASTTVTTAVNDTGNTGIDPGLTGNGSSEEGLNSQTISIASVNDAPTVSLTPVVTNLAEDTDTSGPTIVATIGVLDDDAGTETLSLSGADALLFEIAGSDLRLIAGALIDFESNAELDVTVNVDDATIPGTPDDFANYTVTVDDVNEAPTVSGGVFLLNENSPNGTSVGSISAIDMDTGDSVTLSVVGGTGASAFSLNGVTGGITVANSLLLDFETTPAFTLDVQASDLGGLTDTTTISLNLADVNEAPTISAPAAQSMNENMTLVFSASGGNGIWISDQDAANGLIEATLNVTGGSLTLGQTAGLVFSVGDGTSDAAVSITGTLTDVNAALNNLQFVPATDFVGQVNLQISVNDQGSGGTGGSISTAATIAINVLDTNVAPTGSDDGTIATTQAGTSTDAPGVLANDVDADGDPLTAVLVADVAHGTLTLRADGSFTYIPDSGFVGIDLFQYAAFDGQTLSSPVTVTLSVEPIAPAPSDRGESDASKNPFEPPESSGDPEPDGELEQSSESEGDSSSESVGLGARLSSTRSTASYAQNLIAPLPETSANYSLAAILDTHTRNDLYEFAARTFRTAAIPTPTSNFTSISDAILSLAFGREQGEELIKWDNEITPHELVIGSTAIVSSTLSVGYVVWLLRGGTLLASLLSSIPAWCSFDPLPIVETFEATRVGTKKGDESLTSIVIKAPSLRAPIA